MMFVSSNETDVHITLSSDPTYTEVDAQSLHTVEQDATRLIRRAFSGIVSFTDVAVTVSANWRAGCVVSYHTHIVIRLDDRGWATASATGRDPLVWLESLVCPALLELFGPMNVERVSALRRAS